MPDHQVYGPDHPITLALVAWAIAVRFKIPVLHALDIRAAQYGIKPGSARYDEAAARAGLPYCRALDLYVDRATKARAEALHFSKAHHALLTRDTPC